MAANTTIQLKKSAIPSAVPSGLEYGEIAINYADGKLYYKNVTNQIVEFTPQTVSNYFGTVNANGVLVVADTSGDVFSLVAGDNVTIVGDAINDIITISASVPGGGDPTYAFNQANTARDSANAAYAQANAAYLAANNAVTDYSPAFDKANQSYAQANTARDTANTGVNDAANANAFVLVATAASNTWTNTSIAYPFAQANSAYAQANTARDTANTGVNDAANANAFVLTATQGANAWTNTIFGYSNTYTQTVGAASNGWTNTVYGYVNTAIATANAWTNTQIGIVFDQANSAYDQANSAMGRANAVAAGANAWTNTVFGYSNTYAQTVGAAANGWANGVNTYSDSTYLKLSAAVQTIQGNVVITGNLITQGNTVVLNSQSLNIVDPLIYVAGNNYSSDAVQIGFIGNYQNTTGNTTSHTGLIRDYTTKEYYFFNEYNQEPLNNWVNISGNNFTLAVLNAGLRSNNVILSTVNATSWITASYNQANAAYDQANNAMGRANTVAAGANAWTNTVFGYTNTAIGGAYGWTNTSVTGANAWTNTVFGYANNKFLSNDRVNFAYTGNAYFQTGNVLIGRTADSTAGLALRLDIAGAANASQYYINGTLATAISNSYADTAAAGANTGTGAGANAFARTMGASSNAWTNTVFDYANTKFLSNDRVNFAYTGNVYVSTGNVLIGRTVDSTAGLALKLDIAGAANASQYYINGTLATAIANSYGTAIGVSSNAWTNTVFGYSNSYTQTVGAASNGWSNSIFGFANSKFATSITVFDDAVNVTKYPLFTDQSSGTLARANVDTGFTFNPSTGTLTSVTFNSTSDINKKTDIQDIQNALTIVNNSRGVTFKWKKNQLPSAGVIAQEIEKLFPYAVDSDKYTVNYGSLVGLLIEAIKELNNKVDILNDKISVLEEDSKKKD